MSLTQIAVLILAVWVFLINVTEVTSTVGWIMGLAAGVLVVFDSAYVRAQRARPS
jgi:positive regulator of sigma E activity